MDGTLSRTADTPALAEHFEYIKPRPGRHIEYPNTRIPDGPVVRVDVTTQSINPRCKVRPGQYEEVFYRKQLSPQLSGLTLFERTYLSAK